MALGSPNVRLVLLFLVGLACAMLPTNARSASCKTQSQMTAKERDALSSAARTIAKEMQSGDLQALRANTIPAVAADFSGIASSVDGLKPLVQASAITVISLYMLDASAEPAGTPRTDFFCGSPLVVLNFTNLPAGLYALAILHATGVPNPQQISFILSETSDHHWMLAGFFSKPMMLAGHDGLWYWISARKYAQRNMTWNAWLYYRIAANFLNPVEFLSSPNLEKLQQEANRIRPGNLPGTKPLILDAHGSAFQVTAIDTTSVFGPLDLEIHYTPDTTQQSQLQDPPTARKQVTELMTAMLALQPELQDGFHGIWVHADRGSSSLFSLELPMEQIVLGAQPQTRNLSSAVP